MWTTRLLILGLVRWLQPVHGYDVRRELMSWGVQEQLDIKPGSIYHGLKKLTADGLLEVVTTERVDNRPARTTYRLTPPGETEFHRLLRDKLWNLEPIVDPFQLAWSFASVLNVRETAAMLRNRANNMRAQQEELKLKLSRAADPHAPGQYYIPPHIRESLSLCVEQTRLSIDWCDRMANRVESGEIPMGFNAEMSPEDIERWKQSIRDLDGDGRPRRHR